MATKTSIAILREIASATAVTQYLDHRDFLGAIYAAAKTSIAGYSYLQFADDLGFSKTNVIRLVMVGQRPLTNKAAQKIAKALDIHGDQLRYWQSLVRYIRASLPAERERLFRALLTYKVKAEPQELSPVQAEYFSEWYHPVIREMVALPDFEGDPRWIQQRLGFPLHLNLIKRSLEILLKLKIIRWDSTCNRYVRSGPITTAQNVDSMALVRYHQTMIDMSRESITRIDEQLRDIQAVTVNIPLSAIDVLRGRIQELINAALALEPPSDDESGEREVVQLNIQMFPFTVRQTKREEKS